MILVNRMPMSKDFLRFIVLFVILIFVGYIIHKYCIDTFLMKRNVSLINLSYLLNGSFTLLFTLGIIVFYKKFEDQVGFIFMWGSLVKMGIFIAILKLSGYELNKAAFLDFFVSYAICLTLEVYYISKILNSSK